MSDQPRKAASIWPEMPFMRGPKAADRLRQLVPLLRASRAACEERRQAVLRHDWARQRLCAMFGYADARQWNGYIPPERTPDGAINHMPGRRELLELLAEIVEHERQIGGAA